MCLAFSSGLALSSDFGVVCWVPHVLVEIIVRGRRLRIHRLQPRSHRIHTHLAVAHRVPRPHVHRTLVHFLGPRDQNVVPLRQLSIAHLLVDGALRLVNGNLETLVVQVELHFLTVSVRFLRNGQHNNLPWRDPEWPLAAQMLNQHGQETLDRAQNGPMHDDGSLEARLERVLRPNKVLVVHVVSLENLLLKLLLEVAFLQLLGVKLLLGTAFSLVLQIEADWQLEVTLDRAALVLALEAVVYLDVDLGTVEGAVSLIDRPGVAKLVESRFESTLCLVPKIVATEALLWTRRKLSLERKTKDSVNMVQEVEAAKDLILKLFQRAEQVSVVLTETSDTRQARECARNLVTVKHAKVGKAKGKVPKRANLIVEHKAVAGTVHGLHAEALTLNLPHKHVFLVGGVVARRLPELEVENVGRVDLVVAADTILVPDQLHKLIVDLGTVRVEERTARRELMRVEEVLGAAHVPVVTLLCLLLELDVFVKLLFRREADTVDTLKRVISGVSKPVSSGVLHHLEGLDHLRGGDVRARAQINQVSTLVGRDLATI